MRPGDVPGPFQFGTWLVAAPRDRRGPANRTATIVTEAPEIPAWRRSAGGIVVRRVRPTRVLGPVSHNIREHHRFAISRPARQDLSREVIAPCSIRGHARTHRRTSGSLTGSQLGQPLTGRVPRGDDLRRRGCWAVRSRRPDSRRRHARRRGSIQRQQIWMVLRGSVSNPHTAPPAYLSGPSDRPESTSGRPAPCVADWA
jgi:hypothetical protein